MHIHLKKIKIYIYVYKTLEDFTMLMAVEMHQSCEKGLLMVFLCMVYFMYSICCCYYIFITVFVF